MVVHIKIIPKQSIPSLFSETMFLIPPFGNDSVAPPLPCIRQPGILKFFVSPQGNVKLPFFLILRHYSGVDPG